MELKEIRSFEELKSIIDEHEARFGGEDLDTMYPNAAIYDKDMPADKILVLLDQQDGNYRLVVEDSETEIDVISIGDFASEITKEVLDEALKEIVEECNDLQKNKETQGKHTVLITLGVDETIGQMPYTGYPSMRDAVGGFIEHCGDIQDKKMNYSVWCNEEFLYIDSSEFKTLNAIASAVCGQPIYGPAFIALDTMTDEGMDSVGFSLDSPELKRVEGMLDHFVKTHSSDIKRMHEQLDNNAPEPRAVIMSFSSNEEFAAYLNDTLKHNNRQDMSRE